MEISLEQYNKMAERLTYLEQKNAEYEWIPVSERLPHAEYGESDIVLAYTKDGLYRILYFNGGNWCYPTGECFEHNIHTVIAWMPLPEPYKEINND